MENFTTPITEYSKASGIHIISLPNKATKVEVSNMLLTNNFMISQAYFKTKPSSSPSKCIGTSYFVASIT